MSCPEQQVVLAKARLRRAALARRRALSPGLRRAAAARACGWLLRWVLGQRFAHVGLYWAAGSELDVGAAAARLHACGVHCYLPPPRRALGGPPAMVAWTPGGRGGGGGEGRRWPARRLQLLVLPVVAVDLAGRRLGQGGGWYDRLLAGAADGGRRWPRRVAVAFHCQLAAALPTQAHDVGVERIITERGDRPARTRPPACAS